MAQCPNCGTNVGERSAFCQNCGTELGGSGADPAGSEQARPDRTDGQTVNESPQQPREPTQSHGDNQHPPAVSRDADPQGRQTRGRGAGQSGQARAQQADRHSGGLLRRRRVLAAGGVVALLGAGGVGWYTFLRGSGPREVIDQSWNAWGEGDFDAFQRLYHSDSPRRDEWTEAYRSDFGPAEGDDWTIESRTVTERTETRVTVREVYVYRTQETGANRLTVDYRLRMEDGSWRIWDSDVVESESVDG